jgi:hypothetical protein
MVCIAIAIVWTSSCRNDERPPSGAPRALTGYASGITDDD